MGSNPIEITLKAASQGRLFCLPPCPEQLRFRGKFEFTVRAEEGLEISEISLPPLLVQPFVENALIHGLQIRESGGFVDVVFASKGNWLQCSVSDNGQGFSEKHTPKKRRTNPWV